MAAGTMLTELPSCPQWTYGGLPYGLEPLTLPVPAESAPDEPEDHTGRQSFERTCLLIERAHDGGSVPEDAQAGAETVLWFRWITGHQVSFALWRLMAWLLHEPPADHAGRRGGLASLARYVHGYSAMLRYTSSCSRQVYRDLIRPSMYRQHPGFSGGWAPDYRLVRGIFRGQLPSWAEGPGAAELTAAVASYQAEHAAVAARLVPGGRSLLRDSVAAQCPQPAQPLPGVLYDNYFMTLRAPVGPAHVVAQLLRRLLAIAQDLAARPPAGSADLAGITAGLARAAVADLSRWHRVTGR